jgi:hypothetical protein
VGSEGLLQFTERLLSLIDSGRYSATYKLATLLALVDVTADHVDETGSAPTVLSATDVGRRVVELYWPQTAPYGATHTRPAVLSQSPQRDIPTKLADYRLRHGLLSGATLADACSVDPEAWEDLERELVATVIRMPLAKLQRFGEGRTAVEDRFIYDFSWRDEVPVSTIRRAGFDDSLVLRPGVGEWLLSLATLIRPLVQAKWSERVAKRNPELVDTERLDDFLFGAQRVSLDRIRSPLLDLQDHVCFYCERRVLRDADVDHFLPWSRHPDNGLDNLVAAHGRCNGQKSASLAGLDHLEHWLARNEDDRLSVVAEHARWPRRPERTLAAARAAYLVLWPSTMLWTEDGSFEPFDPDRARRLFAAPG